MQSEEQEYVIRYKPKVQSKKNQSYQEVRVKGEHQRDIKIEELWNTGYMIMETFRGVVRETCAPSITILLIARRIDNTPLFISVVASMEEAETQGQLQLYSSQDIAKVDIHQAIKDGIVYIKTLDRHAMSEEHPPTIQDR